MIHMLLLMVCSAPTRGPRAVLPRWPCAAWHARRSIGATCWRQPKRIEGAKRNTVIGKKEQHQGQHDDDFAKMPRKHQLPLQPLLQPPQPLQLRRRRSVRAPAVSTTTEDYRLHEGKVWTKTDLACKLMVRHDAQAFNGDDYNEFWNNLEVPDEEQLKSCQKASLGGRTFVDDSEEDSDSLLPGKAGDSVPAGIALNLSRAYGQIQMDKSK